MATGSQTPWLSILLPVYNGAATLRDCLGSLTAQAAGTEVILVDQASTDGSLEIARDFEGRLNMTIISAPQNKNWMQNTNLALQYASGAFSTLLHQDDLWLPGRTDMLLDFAARYPEGKLYVHNALYIDENGRPLGRFGPPFGRSERLIPSQTALRSLLVQNTISLPAAMFATDMAREIGGLDERLWYTADWDFWLRLARRGPLAWSPETFCGFRLHSKSLTVQGSRDLEAFRRQLDIPVGRHLEAMPEPQRTRVARAARASNALNVWLAAAFHGPSAPIAPVLWAIVRLGPIGVASFLRHTRILRRVWPRLTLLRRGKR